MKVLIVAATWMEVRLIADEFDLVREKSNILKSYKFKDFSIDILISGIGMTSTTFHLTNVLLTNSYTLVLNVGIAASLNREIRLGKVVNVITEEFADLGIEGQAEFLTLFDSGFLRADEFPFENGVIRNDTNGYEFKLPQLRGITSNKSHGRESSINEIFTKFNAHVESSEGASVFFVCKWMGVPFFEIRAVANYVEPRDQSSWDIPVALDNLKEEIFKILEIVISIQVKLREKF